MIAEDIINFACQVFEIDYNLFISGKTSGNKKNYFDARKICSHLIRKIYKEKYTYTHIAEMLGKRLASGKGDHVFAMYCENCCRDILSIKDKDFCEKYEIINAKILK